MTTKSIWKSIISYAICLTLAVVLIEATWGLTAGVLIGAKIGTDKATQEEISKILKERGIHDTDIPKSILGDGDWYKNLPPEVQKDLGNVVKQKLQEINWFGVTLAVSAVVFAIVGFLCGFINRAFALVGIIVFLSFFVNNPIIRFPQAKDLDLAQKLIIIFLQFGLCYLFGYIGAIFGRKRGK